MIGGCALQIQLSDRVIVPEGVHIQDVSGEAIILNLKTERYYGLNEVGAHMWQALISTESLQAALDALAAEYEIDLPTLRGDLLELVTRLVEDGLLEIAQQPDAA